VHVNWKGEVIQGNRVRVRSRLAVREKRFSGTKRRKGKSSWDRDILKKGLTEEGAGEKKKIESVLGEGKERLGGGEGNL